MADDIVALARQWLGTPYVHQASVKGAGADCLGLIRGLWRERQGHEPEAPPAYTADWGELGDRELLWEAARRWLVPLQPGATLAPGQVLLFRMRAGAIAKHLGVLTEMAPTPTFIHAYTGHGVIESPLSLPWQGRVVARFRFP